MPGAPPNLEVRGAPDSCRKARWQSVLGGLSTVRRYLHLDSTMAVKYHPQMIYILTGIAMLGPLMGVVVAWVLVRHALRSFQDVLEDLIGQAISKQDDRIRKGRERDTSRTPVGQDALKNESLQLAVMIAGQSIPDPYDQRGN